MKHLLLLLTIAAAMMSCEKPEDNFTLQNADNPIISSIGLVYELPSATSKSAAPNVELTIDGVVRDFDLEDDHFYDDGRDEFLHFSQTFTAEVDNQLLRVYFSILVNTDTNLGEDAFIEVSTRDNDYQIITIENADVIVNEADESVTINNGQVSFRLTL